MFQHLSNMNRLIQQKSCAFRRALTSNWKLPRSILPLEFKCDNSIGENGHFPKSNRSYFELKSCEQTCISNFTRISFSTKSNNNPFIVANKFLSSDLNQRIYCPPLSLKNVKNLSLTLVPKDIIPYSNYSTTSVVKSSNTDQENFQRKPKYDLLSGLFSARLVNEYLPESFRPYARLMRLDKPTGTWLLLLPCWWSIGISTEAGHLPPLSTMALFGIGALMMRSAGCIINDIWDRRFDRNVRRTRTRPLASNEVTMVEAVALLASLLGCSLLVLIQFDLKSIMLGMGSLILVSTYPSFKRFTYWPQLILGMTFNWGVLLGWSVICNGELDLVAVLPLYLAGISWTMIYDTIYAHQDKHDDLVLGLKSTALKFGNRTPAYLYGFTALMTASLLSVGLHTEQVWPYYLSVGMVATGLTIINRRLNVDSIESCARAFKQNTQIGWILLMGIIASTLLKKKKNTNQNSNDESGPNSGKDDQDEDQDESQYQENYDEKFMHDFLMLLNFMM